MAKHVWVVAMSSEDARPAGWYADPSGAPMLRWWDGTTWTELTRNYPPPETDVPSGDSNRGAASKKSFGARYGETWAKTGLIVGGITTVLILAGQGYDLSSDADVLALLIDGVIGFVVNFLVWGSLVNLVVAPVRTS